VKGSQHYKTTETLGNNSRNQGRGLRFLTYSCGARQGPKPMDRKNNNGGVHRGLGEKNWGKKKAEMIALWGRKKRGMANALVTAFCPWGNLKQVTTWLKKESKNVVTGRKAPFKEGKKNGNIEGRKKLRGGGGDSRL